jgi:hypothetical protein
MTKKQIDMTGMKTEKNKDTVMVKRDIKAGKINQTLDIMEKE